MTHAITDMQNSSTFSIHGSNDCGPIMTIENTGKVIIHKPDKMGEAGEILVESIHNSKDTLAGFKQNRLEWEEDFVKTLAECAKDEPLTSEQIIDIYHEQKVFNKLKNNGEL